MVLMLFVIAMSVGVIFGRKPLKGSCGGVGKALGEKEYICSVCGDDPNKCDEEQSKNGSSLKADLAYDATNR